MHNSTSLQLSLFTEVLSARLPSFFSPLVLVSRLMTIGFSGVGLLGSNDGSGKLR